MNTAATPWEAGRFDSAKGPRKILFGRMYEDVSVEEAAFRSGGRIFCIASAGDTAMALSERHEVVAADINPVQLSYAQNRIAGLPPVRGIAERVIGFGRTLAPLVGWKRSRVEEFLDLEDPARQLEFFRARLDTRRFRAALDVLFSVATLRSVYAAEFLDFLPPKLGSVFRARMERCFARHPNRSNPYARLLLLGDARPGGPATQPERIRLVHNDAASFLENQAPGSFDGFTLSNILDGAPLAYRARLFSAVRRAAAPGSIAILRSFAEPSRISSNNRAEDDRSMLWGSVEVQPAFQLGEQRQ